MLTMRRWTRHESSKEHHPSSPPLTEAVKMAVGKPKKGWKKLQKAIKSHPDMDERDATGFTAMLHAARLNVPGVILKLAESGANVNLRSNDGNTPFHYACFRESWEAMAMLVQLGADPDAIDANGRTPLIRAIECQDEGLVARLLQLGASPQACGENDVAPLFAALSLTRDVTRHTNFSIVQRLLDAGSLVNAPDKTGSSPLTYVCLQHRHSTELIELLIKRGATVNVRDAYGRTPLTHSLRTDISSGSDCLALLLRAGANTNIIDGDGHTSLSIWAQNLNTSLTYGHGTGRDHQKTLKLLLAYGANPNIVTTVTNSYSLMHTVVRHGRGNEARALLAAGAELILMSECPYEWQLLQRSPIITSLLSGNLPLARLLADGLFYSQKELDFLYRFCSSRPLTTPGSNSLNEKPRLESLSGRLIKSRSRPDIFDSYCNLNLSSLHLDLNANVSSSSVRRSASADTVLNFIPSSSNKLNNNNRESSCILSNEYLADNTEMINMPALKRTQSKYELDNIASVLHVEAENLLNLVMPKTRELIEDLCLKVPSLQKLCRRSVHRALTIGANREEIVKRLPIWPSLQRYILFELPENHACLRFHLNETLNV